MGLGVTSGRLGWLMCLTWGYSGAPPSPHSLTAWQQLGQAGYTDLPGAPLQDTGLSDTDGLGE